MHRFDLMCSAIDEDIESVQGSGADFLEGIRRIECGEKDLIEADGTAWVTYITRDKVWFEGLYSQGEGGAVSLAQYKLAVQTYVRFLSDPERNPIEVAFPVDEAGGNPAVAGGRYSDLVERGRRFRDVPSPRVFTIESGVESPTEEAADPLRLICNPGVWIVEPEKRKRHRVNLDLHVIDSVGSVVPHFELMCEAICCDIQASEESGAGILNGIRHVEVGEIDLVRFGGTAWMVHITRDKVWFGSRYSVGEGGAVGLAQYKLAVQTYARFRADTERKPIEVAFPAH